MPKYTQFNGEFGFDENPDVVQIWKGPFIHETYDINDDEDGDSYVCNPFIDYECDTTMIDKYNDHETIESLSIDIFLLKDNLTLCRETFESLRLLYNNIYNQYDNKDELDSIGILIDTIIKDFIEIDIFIKNPIMYDGDIDMKIMVDSLSKTGYIPNVIILNTVLKELIQEHS